VESFERVVNAAFFREVLQLSEYKSRNEFERLEYVRILSDLRDGVAFPMDALRGDHLLTLYTPDDLHDYLEAAVSEGGANQSGVITFTGHQSELRVIVEGFIDGKEFSCIVVRTDDGEVVALPPTEIVKPASELFDYRSKYMPGRSRKVTPIELPTERIMAIRSECERLYQELGFQVYARIDGFHTASGEIFLNDPNTTSGMMPSSFFFHQAAEIGLNPSQFLTFIVRASLRERGMEAEGQEAMEIANELGELLDVAIDAQRATATNKERIAVILGGTSFERHISVESGRNIYEKLASSEGHRPVPVFLTSAASGEGPGERSTSDYQLYQLPINLLLKDNADDIRDKLVKTEEHPVIRDIRAACIGITRRYADPDVVFEPRQLAWKELPSVADGVFIALHGRPGEDGQVQAKLEPLGLYYNGSGIASSQITIDKHATLETLGQAGMVVTNQWLATREEFFADETAFYNAVETRFGYPLIAKPVDDGCSSAVKLIKQRDELHAYCHLTFQPSTLDEAQARREMKLSAKDEWPIGKGTILFEGAIQRGEAVKFFEITGGMLTHYGVDGNIRYELFEPSETLAGGEILSLEEKFLAGEGQNLTPARMATEDYSYDYVAGQVKADLERAARAVGVEGYCRVDAFVRVFADGRVETVPIEINSLPGMTPATAIFHQAALAGYQPAEFIARILEYGKARIERFVPVAAATPSPKTNPAPAETYFAPIGSAQGAPAAAAILAPAKAATASPAELAETNAFMENTDLPTEEPNTYEETAVYNEPASEKDGFKAKAIGLLSSGWRLLKSGYFWKNFAAAIFFFVLCFFLLRMGLYLYTAHGNSTDLPDFVGMQKVEAENAADDLGLKLKFEKGPFDPNRPPGQVVLQHPKAGAGVKKNRSIYLTILTDEAPLIQLPTLVGNYDYTQYSTRIERMGDIRSKIREQVYDPKQEENTILHIFFGETKVTDAMLRSGYEVPQGSMLEFVVTVRQTGEVKVPDYKCKPFGVVEFLLDGSNLLVGEIHGNVSNQSEAFVMRTDPPGGKMVPVGSKFDIYLSQRRPDDCD
jgi:UDP-N-acetylmuramate--alanine ligase